MFCPCMKVEKIDLLGGGGGAMAETDLRGDKGGGTGPSYTYPSDPKFKCAGVKYAQKYNDFCCVRNYGKGCNKTRNNTNASSSGEGSAGALFARTLGEAVVRRMNYMTRDTRAVCAPLSLEKMSGARVYTSGAVEIVPFVAPSKGTYFAEFTRRRFDHKHSAADGGTSGENEDGGGGGGEGGEEGGDGGDLAHRVVEYGGVEWILDSNVVRPEKYGHQATCLNAWKAAHASYAGPNLKAVERFCFCRPGWEATVEKMMEKRGGG